MALSPERADRQLWALRRMTTVQAVSVAAKLGALLLLVVVLTKFAGGR